MIQRLRLLIADWYVGRPLARRSRGWAALRAAHITREPYCTACGVQRFLEVHHVIPVHVDPTRELDPSNLITLCDGPNRCHLRVGHLKRWDRWNTDVREDAARALCRRGRLGA